MNKVEYAQKCVNKRVELWKIVFFCDDVLQLAWRRAVTAQGARNIKPTVEQGGAAS